MPTESSLIATLSYEAFKAEIYTTELPGEFKVRFIDGTGKLLEEVTLSGVSTYRQREGEIMERLQVYAKEGLPAKPADLDAAGEY